MKAPRGVAFDLDGTLIDSRLDIAAACNHVLVRAGREALPPDVIATFVGDGVRALLARAFRVPEPEGPHAQLDAWTGELIAYYAEHPATHTTWMPGALAALDALAGLPLAVVTNKARLVTLRVLEAMGAVQRFAFIYAGGDGPLKPRPDPVAAVARAFAIDAADLWVVGDSAQDILGARAAGARSVAVHGGMGDRARLEAAGPDAILPSLAELPGLVHGAAS
jgi:phosphoglycolate phosphatase